MTYTQHIPAPIWADPSARPPHLRQVAIEPIDGFVLIANDLTATNELLLDALRRAAPGARFVRPADLATVVTPARGVARLDVTRNMTGLEDGFTELRRFERSADVMNPASALIACHDKLATARLLGRADYRIPVPLRSWSDTTAPRDSSLRSWSSPASGAGARGDPVRGSRRARPSYPAREQHGVVPAPGSDRSGAGAPDGR